MSGAFFGCNCLCVVSLSKESLNLPRTKETLVHTKTLCCPPRKG